MRGFNSSSPSLAGHFRLAILSLLCLAATLVLSVSAAPSPSDFVITSLQRTVELGGSVHGVSDTYKLKQLAPSSHFYVALSASDASRLSSIEASASKGPGGPSAIVKFVRDEETAVADGSVLFKAALPSNWAKEDAGDEEIVIKVHSTILHGAQPLPEEVGQKEEMFLLWTGDAEPRVLYNTDKARVKVKAPHPKLLSYSISPSLLGDELTKSGSVVTLGVFENLRPGQEIRTASVHYLQDSPVISIVKLERHVEISHWGDNVAVEDRLWLRNDGARLKGYFSRITHQMASFYKQANSHTLTNLVVHLPPGARDAYFIDQIGNVSTSNFRPSAASPAHIAAPAHLLPSSRASVLELKPRYPLLGGWNYTFSVGWNMDLSSGGWGKKLSRGSGASSDGYSVAVPLLTPITDVAVDEVETRIVLPEGATDVSFSAPFDLDEVSTELHTTYLDTMGRPALVVRKKRASERHGSLAIVTYRLSAAAHLRKPVAVALVTGAILVAVAAARRFDAKIGA